MQDAVLREEALRYMGYQPGTGPDGAVLAAMARCFSALDTAARFRDIHRVFPLTIHTECVHLAGLLLRSGALAGHLSGCAQAALYAATLGAEVDRLMRRTSSTDMGEAVVLQACAAALLEQRVEQSLQALAQAYAAGQLFLLPRYSPGYGDFSLEHQRGILDVLDAGRRIGLSCTGGNMLTPTKSITAVIGVSPHPAACAGTGCPGSQCAHCGLEHCAMKRSNA